MENIYAKTPLCSVSYAEEKENSTQDTTVSAATFVN